MSKVIKMARKKVGSRTTKIKSGVRGSSKSGKNPLRTRRSVVKRSRRSY